jgi:phage-related protein
MSSPEQIQRDIEGTRQSLSADVDRLTEKVSPGRVVSRRVDRVKGTAGSLKDRVMGSMPDTDNLRSAGGSAGSTLSSATGAVGNAVSGIGDAASSAPQVVRQQAQGNPLAAGLVAFGVGMVIASLAPATQKEQDLAAQAEDKARGPLQDKAKEVASELQGSAQESVQQIKDVASQGASDTADQARSAAEDVKAPLQQ